MFANGRISAAVSLDVVFVGEAHAEQSLSIDAELREVAGLQVNANVCVSAQTQCCNPTSMSHLENNKKWFQVRNYINAPPESRATHHPLVNSAVLKVLQPRICLEAKRQQKKF
jgi:hypothetical protein